MNTSSFSDAKKLPELLAPAGSYECLKAAVQGGADAVYLGLKSNNARIGAENFDFATLEDAVSYAHSYGVKVFLTLNTLVNDNEIQDTIDSALKAAELGVDALIIQDMGLGIKLLEHRRKFPSSLPLEIHASTQMSIYNVSGLKFLKSLGFDRCITARELRLTELAEMCRENIMDIEFFCHGALCISLSGQCLLSSYLSGGIEGSKTYTALPRSGNRGTCAGPCRLKYTFQPDKFSQISKFNYKLSPSDIATLNYLDELIATGVHSLKIEGRLKSPEYVAYVTRQYRNALDNYARYGTSKINPGENSTSLTNMQLLFGRDTFISGNHFGLMQQDAITLDYSGRKGLFLGTITEAPTKLTSPKGMPKNLTLFRIKVKGPDCGLKNGDGITVLRGKILAGGSINKIEKSANSIHITVAGTVEDNYFFTEKTVAAPVYYTFSSQLYDDIHLIMKDGYIRTKSTITAHFMAKTGSKPILTYTFENISATAMGKMDVQPATNTPVSSDCIKSEISKLGNTSFTCTDISLDIDENIFLPMSEIKKLRRDAIGQLYINIRLAKIAKNSNSYPTDNLTQIQEFVENTVKLPDTSLYFYNYNDFLRYDFSNITRPVTVYLPMLVFEKESLALMCKQKMSKLPDKSLLLTYFPYINIGNNYKEILSQIQNAAPHVDGYMLSNPGDIQLFAEFATRCLSDKKYILTADHSFNVYNKQALDFYTSLGISCVTLSPELSSSQVNECVANRKNINKGQVEYIVSGPITLMRMRYCLLSDGKCKQCKKADSCSYIRKLTDTNSNTFIVKSLGKDCHNLLLSEPLKRQKIPAVNLIARYNILSI